MGASGVDVQLSSLAYEAFPFSVECKNQEVNKSFLNMWEQAVANSQSKDTMLVLSANHSPTLAIIELDYLMQVLKRKSNEQS